MSQAPVIPAQVIANLWNWLPAFRVVAETESLTEAGRLLHVSPSALSRTMKLLEEELRVLLFERRGRALALTPEGRLLLSQVRMAMRAIDDGLMATHGTTLSGTVRVSSAGIASLFVLRALARWADAPAGLQVEHRLLDAPTAQQALAMGQIDVAFHETPMEPQNDTQLRLLTKVQSAVFCGPLQPLYEKRRVDLDEVLAAPFVGPHLDENGMSPDGWPGHIERNVLVRVESLRHGVEVCRHGGLLAFLPTALAEPELRALPSPVEVETLVFAMTRAPVSAHKTKADLIVEAVEREVAAFERRSFERR